LRIESPGGSALTSELIWHAIEKLKEEKPVIVSIGDVAAQGDITLRLERIKFLQTPSALQVLLECLQHYPMLPA
jgi:Periplasmic serine proteases (ClpP class)